LQTTSKDAEVAYSHSTKTLADFDENFLLKPCGYVEFCALLGRKGKMNIKIIS
jgi:hypothetical protein